MFPLNCWYVAATSDELKHKPLGRTICNKNVVFYRMTDGTVAAMEDFCPHRGLPLSLGVVQGEHLVCGYHGLEMNANGKCAAMPSQGENIKSLKGVHSYPIIERYGYVWIWPGDTDKADETLLPNLAWAEDPEWAFGGSYFNVKCDYRLLIDNLMDLTHETYVHSSSIGQPEIDEAEPTLEVTDKEVVFGRHMENLMPPPFWREALKGNGIAHDILCDRWQICHFVPPCQVMIEVGVAHVGKGGSKAEEKHRASGIVVDLITPETDTSCHYFWGLARNFSVHNKRLTTQILEAQTAVFSEDIEVLQKQQENLIMYNERRLLSFNTDAGGRHARLMLDNLVKAEQA